MYIRRKVYSAFEDYDGEIRYFSTNEIISEEDYLERLYSEDYLDDDDMERLFSEDGGLSTGAKIAIGAGTTAVAAPLALVGLSKGKKALSYKAMLKKARMGNEAIEKAVAGLKGQERAAARRKLQKEADAARQAIADGYEGKGIGFVENILEKGKAKVEEGRAAAKKAVEQYQHDHPSKKRVKEMRQELADYHARTNTGAPKPQGKGKKK